MEEKKAPEESPLLKTKAPSVPPQRGLRIFVSECNSLFGYTLIEELRNDHLEDDEEGKAHLFVGTLDRLDITNPPPSNVKRVFSCSKKTLFTKVLNDCDVIIYSALTADPDEIRFVTSSNMDLFNLYRIQGKQS